MGLKDDLLKNCLSELVDLKVKFDYHGQERCALIDTEYSKLYCLNYDNFCDFLKEEIPQLARLCVLRISFMDDENTYIDLTSRNFHRFLRISTSSFRSATPKINLRVEEGSSPLPKNEKAVSSREKVDSRRVLFDSVSEQEYRQDFVYKSPVELEINIKQREISHKEAEAEEVGKLYEAKWKENNPLPTAIADTSKSICTRCHLRMGHSKNRCHMNVCESASICGILDKHPAEKKEVQDLMKRKQKVENELKTLTCELQTKKKASTSIKLSFEMKLHDILINTNPAKYLTERNRPKEGLILADTYIIKKYYGNINPSKSMLEKDADLFQTIIESYEEKLKTNVPKNCVQKQLEMQGVQLPTSGRNSPLPIFAAYSPMSPQLFSWPNSFQPFMQPQGSWPCATPPPPPAEEYPPPPTCSEPLVDNNSKN